MKIVWSSSVKVKDLLVFVKPFSTHLDKGKQFCIFLWFSTLLSLTWSNVEKAAEKTNSSIRLTLVTLIAATSLKWEIWWWRILLLQNRIYTDTGYWHYLRKSPCSQSIPSRPFPFFPSFPSPSPLNLSTIPSTVAGSTLGDGLDIG